jgi:hypothetical protein
LLSSFSKDVDSDSALKVLISGEWSHFSFHMERTVDVPSIIGLLNHINTGFKHRSNVQGNEEKPVFNKSVSIKCLSESVNIATVKHLLLNSEKSTETETNLRILPMYIYFLA